MKRILSILIIVLTLVALCSCDSFDFDNLHDKNDPTMTAEIVAIGDKIEVNVIEGEYGASGIYWVITGNDTVYLDKNGVPFLRSSLSIGDKIKITYSGQVMMSYPPQIVAKKIVILDD